MNIKKKTLIPFATLALLLVGCGPKESTNPVVIFRQARAADVKVAVKSGMTMAELLQAAPDFVYDSVSEPEGWYEARWFGLPESIESITKDVTVSAVFDAKIFNAHFKLTEEGTGAEKLVPYTFLDYRMDKNHLRSEPEVPNHEDGDWYNKKWSTYTLAARDITVTPVYNVNGFLATFVDEEGVTVAEKSFTVADYYARPDHRFEEEPEVPVKKGFIGAWEEYELSPENMTISPVYEAISTKAYYPDGTYEEFTYGEPYELKAPTETLADATYYEKNSYVDDAGEVVPLKGTWKYGEDIILKGKFVKISFEDGEVPTYLTVNSAHARTVEIDSTNAIDGEKSMKITLTRPGVDGVIDFFMTQEYYAAAFSDPDVQAITLYAKASFDTNNVAYRYWTQAGQQGRKSATYHLNKNGWGIKQAHWQRFTLTREIYNTIKEFDIASLLNIGNVSQNSVVWVDDIDVTYQDPTLMCGFEEVGKITQPTEESKAGRVAPFNAEEEKNSFHSNSDTFTVKDFEINQDPAFVKEGHSSLKLTKTWAYKADGVSKNFYAALNMDTRIVNAMDDNDTLEMDIYASEGFLSNDVCDDKGGKLASMLGGQWNHYSFTKAQLDLAYGRFMTINGSQSEGTLYFDNIHVVRVA